jgi:NADH-quinone oxidoreductase subunit M
MLLTGAMSKMGVYGFVRILLPIFPEQINAVLNLLLWLAVITIVFSAFAAFAQKDLKRMLAYSSINHLGYCLLGVFAVARLSNPEMSIDWAAERAAALNGIFVQMFNHGIVAATLFCFVTFLENRSEGQRGLDDFGGLRKVVPVFCGLMGISTFASIGLPGLNGFIGEFLIFKGVFALTPWAAAVSVIALLVTAVFLLTFLQRVFNGPLNEKWKSMPDLTTQERWLVAPAIVLMFVIGIFPQTVIQLTNATVIQLVEHLSR